MKKHIMNCWDLDKFCLIFILKTLFFDLKMSRKKILFVIGGLDVGGTEMHLLRLLPEFPEAEFEIILFTISSKGALRGAFERNKIKVISISDNSFFAKLSD